MQTGNPTQVTLLSTVQNIHLQRWNPPHTRTAHMHHSLVFTLVGLKFQSQILTHTDKHLANVPLLHKMPLRLWCQLQHRPSKLPKQTLQSEHEQLVSGQK